MKILRINRTNVTVHCHLPAETVKPVCSHVTCLLYDHIMYLYSFTLREQTYNIRIMTKTAFGFITQCKNVNAMLFAVFFTIKQTALMLFTPPNLVCIHCACMFTVG